MSSENSVCEVKKRKWWDLQRIAARTIRKFLFGLIFPVPHFNEGNSDALTPRAVAATAGVQAPAIYRLFGDKSGLLDAVAEHGFAAYLKEKRTEIQKLSSDPIENLRIGWDLHVGFALANPALFKLMYGDPRPDTRLSAAAAAYEILKQRIRQIAIAGQLRVVIQIARSGIAVIRKNENLTHRATKSA